MNNGYFRICNTRQVYVLFDVLCVSANSLNQLMTSKNEC